MERADFGAPHDSSLSVRVPPVNFVGVCQWWVVCLFYDPFGPPEW